MIAQIPTDIELESKTPAISIPNCTRRPLDYYLNCGEAYRKQKEASSHEEWKEFKKLSGASFVENCLKMLSYWNELPQSLQEELKGLPLPAYLPLTSALNLIKVPPDSLPSCISSLREIHREQGNLLPKHITATAKLFHPKVKRTLTPGEEVTSQDWQLIAKKYKLKSPEQLEALQAGAKELSGGETVLTEQVLQALAGAGYDPRLILPKPKKKYTEQDLDKAVQQERQSYQQENDLLKQRIRELEIKEARGNAPAEEPAAQEAIQVEGSEVPLPETLEPALPETLEAAPETLEAALPETLEALPETLEAAPETLEAALPETLEAALQKSVIESERPLPATHPGIKTEIETLKDLKGYNVIVELGGSEKRGTFRVQNGTGHTAQIKAEPDGKIYCLNFKDIRLEYPYNSEQYSILADLIAEHHWAVEDRKAGKMGGFRDLLPR